VTSWDLPPTPLNVWDKLAFYGLLAVMLPPELMILWMSPLAVQLVVHRLRARSSKPAERRGPLAPS
jgi:hypothetical protein